MKATREFRFRFGVSVVLSLAWGSATAPAGPMFPGPEYAVGGGPTSVAIEDLDGDGDADLAVANRLSDDVSILLNQGDGTFATDLTYCAHNTPWSIAIADLNGDGHADLAVVNRPADYVSILLQQLPPGDFDGDGDPDLDDYGVFADCMEGLPGCAPEQSAEADLDHDGDVDLQDFAGFQTFFTG